MKFRLSPGQSRILAVALLLVIVALVSLAFALPTWLLHQRYDAALENYSDRLARYRRITALRPAIEDAIRAAESGAGRQYYLKGTSPAAAAAELQGLVTKIIETHKGKIVSSQALPAKAESKSTEPTKTAIAIQMNAAILPLLLILHTIETGYPYLFVEQLTVRAGQGRAFRPVAGVEPEYVVQLTVFGFTTAAGAKP